MSIFQFKYFEVNQEDVALKISTDAFLLGALIDYSNKWNILDIGTGSGVLALIAAQNNAKAKIDAVEIDELTSQRAKVNFQNSPWKERLSSICIDAKEYESDKKFDLIISNPPYFQASTLSENERTSNAKHTLNFSSEDLLNTVSRNASDDCDFWCILPNDHSQPFIDAALSVKLCLTKKINIYGNPTKLRREVYCFSKQKQAFTESSLIVRDEKGRYTKAYKELTKELHDREL